MEPGVGSTTIDLHVKYLRPLPQNTLLIAEARVTNLSRRLGIAEGTVNAQLAIGLMRCREYLCAHGVARACLPLAVSALSHVR